MTRRTAPLALILLALASAPTLAAPEPATRPTTARAATPATFPTFGAAFDLPGGWAEIPREKAGRVGQWISPDSKPDGIKGMIMIETGKNAGVAADVMAKALARNFGGVVLDEPTTLGGEPAVAVRADNHDEELAPTEGIVCVHGGHVYLVMAGTVKDRNVRAEIEAVRKSWRWTAVEKPAAHLAPRAEPFEAFAGRAKLNVPALMHVVAADDPDAQLDLAMFNLARNNADFRASMTLATLGPDETFEAARDRFLADLPAKHKFTKAAPAWRPVAAGGDVGKASTPRAITPAVEADRPQPAETDTLHHQWAVVSLGAKSGRVVLIHFTHEAETDEERKQYEAAAEAIVASVTPAEAGKKVE